MDQPEPALQLRNGFDHDVHDEVVRLLRPREGAARLEGPHLRRGRHGRRRRLPRAAPGADRRLDGASDRHRRAPDRRLHRTLAARQVGAARRAARRVAARRTRLVDRQQHVLHVAYGRVTTSNPGLTALDATGLHHWRHQAPTSLPFSREERVAMTRQMLAATVGALAVAGIVAAGAGAQPTPTTTAYLCYSK